MQFEEHAYKGHTVTITLNEDKRGGWSWSYTIDGAGHYHCMQDRPVAARDIALLEARNDAEYHINQM